MKIDEKKIRKEYKKLLGSFYTEFYNPLDDYFNDCGWSAILSDRSRGKTTNVLLLAMLLNKHYGIIPHYIRRREKEDLAPKTLKDLFKTIKEFGYIEKLTDGEYNDVEYRSRRWYYIKRTEEGIVAQAQDHFMMCMALDNADSYKSTYNAPKGDLIILDEFIPLAGSRYLVDEFILLVDIIKTVFRDRTEGCKVMCLSNTISKYSPYFVEWGCQKEVQKMSAGDTLVHQTKIGTKIKISFLGQSLSKQRQISNSKFFGFENPKLGMLNNAQWQLKIYPHPLFRVKETELINAGIFLKHAEQCIQLELRYSDDIGNFVVVHPTTSDPEEREEKIIYSLESKPLHFYRYKTGCTKFDRRLWDLYDQNKFYYSDNEVGELLEDYLFKSKHF